MSVKYGLLALLYQQTHYGYELKIELESLLDVKAKINPGQVYTTLDRLMRDDLVSSQPADEETRRLFELEPQGKKELEKWLLEPVSYHAGKEDFFFKWICARKIQYHEEKRMLNQQKELIIKEVMNLTRIKTEYLIQGNENRYLLISGTLLRLEADLNWINQVENRSR